MMRPYGVQLYTLRKPFAKDPLGTLSRIREVGFDAVEFAAPLDLDYVALSQHLREIALDCPSAHVGLGDMQTRPNDVLAMAEVLGCRYLVLPFILPEERDWTRVIRTLADFAELAEGRGIGTAYHHHSFEFETVMDVRPFDRLVAETDPAKIFFELDVYWLKFAGEDPLETIKCLEGRVRLLHLKDWKPDGKMADVGSGALDIPALIAAGEKAGVEHMFVEHDMPPEPNWPSVEASLGYLLNIA